MNDVDALVALGMAPELAAKVVQIVDAASSTAAVSAALAAKTEIAALTSGSTAANIVSALQA